MIVTPDFAAGLALVAWFPISIALFALFRPTVAAPVVLLGAMLLLPVRAAFDFPGFPALDKELIGNLSALAGVVVFAPRIFVRKRVGRGIESLIAVLMVSAALTASSNPDPLFYGPTTVPAMGRWDVVSLSVQQLFNFGIPFVLGRILFSNSKDLRFIFLLLVVAGLIYSLPALFEIRMSPTLHQAVYGYFQHFFHQSIRLGGYRPVVFMPHGLALSVFVLVTAMAATSLARTQLRIGPIPVAAAALYLSGLLVLCRSLGALLYGIVFLPAVALMRPRWQLRLASVLAMLVIAYPATRAAGLFPTGRLTAFASAISQERADSLEFRFHNEDLLLDKAGKRVWFGWGTYNRNRVFDSETGEVDSITDGYWIIQLGSRGVVGFASVFGLLLLPIWRAHRQLSGIRSRNDRTLIAGLALVIAVYALDLIPNGFLFSFTVFLAGALTGLVTGLQGDPRRRGPRRPKRSVASASESDRKPASLEPTRLRDLCGHRLRLSWRLRASLCHTSRAKVGSPT